MKVMITKVALAAALAACVATPVAAEPSVTSDLATEARIGRWLGPDGAYLPFSTDEEVLEFLRTAEVVSTKVIEGSLNRPLKLLLLKEGVRAHAIFRTVNVERETMRNVQEHARGFRDHYEYEVAAYELSRLLGLDNVPPAILRNFGRERGSVQLWVEQAMGVGERLSHGIDKQYEQFWLFQKQNMAVFDNLIYNFDRHPGNMLVDSRGQAWFIDHTRAFKKLPALNGRADIKVCQRSLYEKLRQLNSEAVQERLDPYLTKVEIDALMARQKKLVKFLEKKIKQYGEDAILFQFVRT
jgi:hypothetical protein